jgi:hypothetical protein
MALVRFAPDPNNGGRYMLDLFECAICGDRVLRVRPVRRAVRSRVYPFERLGRFRPTG